MVVRCERKQTTTWYSLNLKKFNGLIIRGSEVCGASQGRDKGIERVMPLAPKVGLVAVE